jgi:hypothetical protein
MSHSIVTTTAKALSGLFLAGATLAAGLASAAEPSGDAQALARELLSHTHLTVSAAAASAAYSNLPEPQEQARRMLLGGTGTIDPHTISRSEVSLERAKGRSSARAAETHDLARRMILGRQA